jgi:hypothetical protein
MPRASVIFAKDANRPEPYRLEGPFKFLAATTVSTVFPDRAILSQTTGPVQKKGKKQTPSCAGARSQSTFEAEAEAFVQLT